MAGTESALDLDLSPEYRLLIGAADPREDHGPAAASLDGPLAWEELLGLAERHRLGPLLWRHLSEGAACSTVPLQVLEVLEQAYLSTTAANMLRQSRLHQVLGALGEAGVPVILLKGAALVAMVYPDLGSRPMVDLDVLVPEAEIDRAHETVRALGYQVNPQQSSETHASMRERHYHYPSLVSDDGLMAVEVHRHVLMGPTTFDISGFWRRARPGARGGSYLLPAPEDLLLHVSIHFSYDRLYWSRGALGQLVDLAWIIERQALDWEAFVGQARDYGLGGSVFLAMLATNSVFAGIVPDRVLEGLRPESYRSALGRRFVEERVLGTRSWLVPWLPRPEGRRPVLAERIVPGRDYLLRHYGVRDSGTLSVLRLYARRMVQGAGLVTPLLARPGALVTEVRLNRWLRSLGVTPMC